MNNKKYDYEQLSNAIFSNASLYNIPKSFTFYETPSTTFVFFLMLNRTFVSSLYFLPIPHNQDQIEFSPLPVILSFTQKKESKEEELLRERQRKFTIGVTEYYILEDKEIKDKILILIPASSSVFRVSIDVNTFDSQCDEISALLDSSAVRMDTKWVPNTSGNLYSFFRDGEIFLSNNINPEIKDGENAKEFQITNSKINGKRAGEAEYIIQEEFDRFTGYWWSDDSQSISQNTKLLQVLYIEVDESKVKEYQIPESGICNGTSTYKYPFAGADNVDNYLYIADVYLNTITQSVYETKIKPLSFSLAKFFNQFCEEQFAKNEELFRGVPKDFKLEYIVRAGWLPSNKVNDGKVWLQLLNRSQSILQLVHIDIRAFKDDSSLSSYDPSSLISLVQIEVTPVWINVTKVIEYLKDGSGRIIWGSERNGYRHLYLLTPPSHSGENSLYSSRQLTDGKWIVDDDNIWVDYDNQVVYFYGTKDSPLEKHVYFTSFADDNLSQIVHRLTELNYFHSTSIAKNFRYFVSTFSNTSSSYSTSFFKFNSLDNSQKLLTQFKSPTYFPVNTDLVSTATQTQFSISPIKFFNLTSSSTGEKLYGGIILPASYKEGDDPLPTIVYVYGVYAAMGYAVLIVDNVGSNRRGLHFEGHVKKNFGNFEVADQVDGVKYAVDNKFTDPNRVLITGWSYGGYMSLMCLSQYPNVFKIAVAGAPVVDWKGYDTGYTERYMNTPQEAEAEYDSSSVINFVNGFPNDRDRLFIAHGLQDENVHFAHTSLLIEHLVKLGKPYRLLFYPTERHGMRNQISARYQEKELLYIITNYL